MFKGSSVLKILAGLILCAAACPCLAHEVAIPPWRGSALSTYEDWRFGTNANPAVPEAAGNLYGTPSASITLGRYASGWLNQLYGLGTQSGYWDLGREGTIQLTIPNPPNAPGDSAGWVSVQATYFVDLHQAPTVIVPGAVQIRIDTRVVENVATGGQWVVEQTLWRSAPCPTSVGATLTSAWNGSAIDEVVVDTCRMAAFSGVGAAKQLPDNSTLELTGAVVTRTFGTFFYVEDQSRVAGIRVNCAAGQTAPSQGKAPIIVGTIRTIDGERVVDQATTYGQDTLPIPAPFAMPARSVATGLSPVGLRVRLTGRASVPSPTATVFTLDDGSGQPVRVELHNLAAPQDGKFVSVSGVIGADTSGPILRSNSSDTLISY